MVLPTMNFLLEMFEEEVEKYRHDKYMSICIDAGLGKLTEYYQKQIERLPILLQLSWILPKKGLIFGIGNQNGEQSLKTFWEQSYCSSTGLVQRVDLANPDTETSNNAFQRWIAKKQAQPIDNLEKLVQYVSEARLIEVGSLISWWISPAQRSRFPLLSSMAIDIFSIPAMSSKVERVFSGAKLTISDGRSSLYIDTIEALECLKSWFRAGIFT